MTLLSHNILSCLGEYMRMDDFTLCCIVEINVSETSNCNIKDMLASYRSYQFAK